MTEIRECDQCKLQGYGVDGHIRHYREFGATLCGKCVAERRHA